MVSIGSSLSSRADSGPVGLINVTPAPRHHSIITSQRATVASSVITSTRTAATNINRTTSHVPYETLPSSEVIHCDPIGREELLANLNLRLQGDETTVRQGARVISQTEADYLGQAYQVPLSKFVARDPNLPGPSTGLYRGPFSAHENNNYSEAPTKTSKSGTSTKTSTSIHGTNNVKKTSAVNDIRLFRQTSPMSQCFEEIIPAVPPPSFSSSQLSASGSSRPTQTLDELSTEETERKRL